MSKTDKNIKDLVGVVGSGWSWFGRPCRRKCDTFP